MWSRFECFQIVYIQCVGECLHSAKYGGHTRENGTAGDIVYIVRVTCVVVDRAGRQKGEPYTRLSFASVVVVNAIPTRIPFTPDRGVGAYKGVRYASETGVIGKVQMCLQRLIALS